MAKKQPTNLGPTGLSLASFHVDRDADAKTRKELRLPPPVPTGVVSIQESLLPIDATTAARRHLERLVTGGRVPGIPSLAPGGRSVDFKSLGSQPVPFTETTIVKFREQVDLVPVFGSYIAIELGPDHAFVSMDAAVVDPALLPSALAKASPSQAAECVRKEARMKAEAAVGRPRQFFRFNESTSAWQLVYIVEEAPAPPTAKEKARRAETALTRRCDYVIDAQSGRLIQAVPRNFGVVRKGTFPDELRTARPVTYEVSGSPKRARLIDAARKVSTHDAKFGDVEDPDSLPGAVVSTSSTDPKWKPGVVSAHANACAVLDFMRQVVRRNGVDDLGAELISSVNCVSSEEPVEDDPKGWMNAYWNGAQMAYGQVRVGKKYRSLAAAQDIVGHEIWHGVTEYTSDLVYQGQTGALNESYSDVFGILIANWAAGRWASADRANEWDWLIGEDLLPNGKPFRSLSDPEGDPRLAPEHVQPKFFKDYQNLPVTPRGDMGGVHINSGIPNYLAYLILTATDKQRKQVFTSDEVAQIYYVTLTARLNRTADFAAHRKGLINSAQSITRHDPDGGKARVAALTRACKTVGL